MLTFRAPGAVFTEREHTVPLDHADPTGADDHGIHPRGRRARWSGSPVPRLPPGRPRLRGGPADEPADRLDEASARSTTACCSSISAGTGRSTPGRADDPGRHAARSRPTYLTHFRADSIVRDAELIRQELGVERWSVLGQSFGGFTSMTYLSIAPEGLARGVHHRRPVADRAAGRRHLRRHVSAAARGEPRATSSATRTTEPGSATSCGASMTRTCDCRVAIG